LALKLIIRDQVLVGDDAIKSLDSGGVGKIREKFLWFFFFFFFLEKVVKLRETLAPSGLMGPKGLGFFF
jgi:hypothetical protein